MLKDDIFYVFLKSIIKLSTYAYLLVKFGRETILNIHIL